ncbi:RNA polymerase sigma factor [Streptomyces achromogenes]|uniref:RNA polymerase sigma factor n=1 Tax=Streptomyces achromogenes TaxID=67255 RepID=UPI00368B1394
MPYQANAKINSPAETPDLELIARAAAGDRDAFATLYNDHRSDVFRSLARRTRDHALAEDLTQETFLRALRRIDTFRHRPTTGGFAGWLSAIARNLYLDHLKLHRTTREVATSETFLLDEPCESAEESVLRELDTAATVQAVETAMQTLTAYQRTVVRHRHIEELSVKETAARMGKHPRAVTTVTFRAMRKIETALVAQGVAA